VNEGLPAVCELWHASRSDIAASSRILPGIALGRAPSEAHPDSSSNSAPQSTSGGMSWTQPGAPRTGQLRLPKKSAIASETSSGRGNPAGSSGDHGPNGSIPGWSTAGQQTPRHSAVVGSGCTRVEHPVLRGFLDTDAVSGARRADLTIPGSQVRVQPRPPLKAPLRCGSCASSDQSSRFCRIGLTRSEAVRDAPRSVRATVRDVRSNLS
jgi:hypothetical protein